jgi:hypothetical protein
MTAFIPAVSLLTAVPRRRDVACMVGWRSELEDPDS